MRALSNDVGDYLAAGFFTVVVVSLAVVLIAPIWYAVTAHSFAELLVALGIGAVIIVGCLVGLFVLGFIVLSAAEGYDQWGGR